MDQSVKKDKRVVAYLCGGLGNQLFIYAAARTLADQTGRALILNVDAFLRDTVYKRTFALDGFHIRYDGIQSVTPLWRCKARKEWERFSRKLGLIDLALEEHHFRFNADFFGNRIARTIRVEGYFQSELYFCANSSALLSDLTFRDATGFECTPEYQRITQAEKSVFVHIRSYKDIPGKQDGSAVLPIDYYQKALCALHEKIGVFQAFVFSDDVAWAQQWLSAPAPIETYFVPPSGKGGAFDQMRDFHLMQCCQHGIVANSSFSWWAGWLGEKRQALQGVSRIILRPFLASVFDYYPKHWESIGAREPYSFWNIPVCLG